MWRCALRALLASTGSLTWPSRAIRGAQLLDFYSLRGLNKWCGAPAGLTVACCCCLAAQRCLTRAQNRRHYVWYEFTFLVGMLFLAWAALSLLRHTKR